MKTLMMYLGLIAISASAFAQESDQSSNLVQYDPLFWKDKLKLNSDQCLKIREINGEYYENLFIAYREEKDNRDALRRLANESLLQRNQEIWETFHPKQRKRWKRMWNASTVQLQRNDS